jgi:DNA-binding transcriptional ArsR family regulator
LTTHLGKIMPMDLSRPYASVLGGALEGEVLSVLAGTTRPLTGRQIARLAAHGSDRGLRLALNRLADQGLVDTMEAPPAVLYSLNRDHIAAPVALQLAALRSELVRRLRAALSTWQVPPVHASMFGSAARGDGNAHSDIDLLLVRSASVDGDDPVWRDQVQRLADAAERWTGNHAGISEIGEEELLRLATERPPIVEELEQHATTLAGPDARRLLRTAGR